ncbi:unnamed protein product [Closterium sp. Naga37s-1]|nr:unnamed protein product [Closterium sp. Naga37s-1]
MLVIVIVTVPAASGQSMFTHPILLTPLRASALALPTITLLAAAPPIPAPCFPLSMHCAAAAARPTARLGNIQVSGKRLGTRGASRLSDEWHADVAGADDTDVAACTDADVAADRVVRVSNLAA